jgi:hypothetical protein
MEAQLQALSRLAPRLGLAAGTKLQVKEGLKYNRWSTIKTDHREYFIGFSSGSLKVTLQRESVGVPNSLGI